MKMKKLRRNRHRYYTTNRNNKQKYRKMFVQTFICILIVLAILAIKLLNTDSTNKTIKVIKSSIENDRSIKADGLAAFNKIKSIDIMGSIFDRDEGKEASNALYTSPVTGTIYRDYGEYKKGNDIQVFNKGIDIIANNDAVKAVSKGVVVEIGKDTIYGNFMIIKHNDYLVKYYGFEAMYKSINDEVEKDDIIGKLKSNDDQLNFRIEVYKDNEAVDPVEELDLPREDILLI